VNGHGPAVGITMDGGRVWRPGAAVTVLPALAGPTGWSTRACTVTGTGVPGGTGVDANGDASPTLWFRR